MPAHASTDGNTWAGLRVGGKGRTAMQAKRTVNDIMTPNPVTVTPRNAIRTAINLMREGGYRRLPVVDRGRLVGIITDRDLRRAANSPIVVAAQSDANSI